MKKNHFIYYEQGEDRGGGGWGGGALCLRFQLKPVYNYAVDIFCFGYDVSWYNHAVTLQMIATWLTAEESSAYLVISKIHYFVHLQKKKKSLIYIQQSVLLSWCRCDTELIAFS